MMKNRNRILLVSTAILAVSAFLAACSATPLPPLFVSPPTAADQAATAQPVGQPAVPTAVSLTASEPTVAATPVQVEATEAPPATAEPTLTPTQVAPTATPTAQKQAQAQPTRVVAKATATRIPTRAPVRPTPTRVKPSPTPEWPKTLTVTAQQLEEQASSVPGLQVTGLDVTFDDNSMTLSADRLRYSIVSIRNLVVQGHFTASNCDVTFVADSIQPRNLATSSIPNIVNQSLDQQLGQWCVETISIAPGELVATVRPR